MTTGPTVLNSSYSNHILSIKTSPKSDIMGKSYQGNKIELVTFGNYPDWVVPYFYLMDKSHHITTYYD